MEASRTSENLSSYSDLCHSIPIRWANRVSLALRMISRAKDVDSRIMFESFFDSATCEHCQFSDASAAAEWYQPLNGSKLHTAGRRGPVRTPPEPPISSS